MKKATPKKKAPVQLTAGTGFRNENCIAARFLLDLLAGTDSLGEKFGKIDRVQWQGRDLGWLADDLVIECSASAGKRAAGISIKSDRQVTGAGFPPDFVAIAWKQWFGVETERILRGSDDAVVLMVGSLSHDVEDAWSNLISDALITTPDRMLARLVEPEAADGSQSSALQRALFASLRCPDELRNEGDASDSAALQLLWRVRLMRFDFEATPSRNHDHALRDCQNVLRSGDAEEAKSLPAYPYCSAALCMVQSMNRRGFGGGGAMARNLVQFQKGLSEQEFDRLYGTEELCRAVVIGARWPDGFECPACGGRKHSVIKSR